MARRAKCKCIAAFEKMNPILSSLAESCLTFAPTLSLIRGVGD